MVPSLLAPGEVIEHPTQKAKARCPETLCSQECGRSTGGAKGIDFRKKGLEIVFKASLPEVKGCLSIKRILWSVELENATQCGDSPFAQVTARHLLTCSPTSFLSPACLSLFFRFLQVSRSLCPGPAR